MFGPVVKWQTRLPQEQVPRKGGEGSSPSWATNVFTTVVRRGYNGLQNRAREGYAGANPACRAICGLLAEID